MDHLTTFKYKTGQITAVDIDGEAWFSVNDVCKAMGIGHPSQALKTRVEDVDRRQVKVPTAGGPQWQNFVNVFGLFSLIFRSHPPEAMEFQRWAVNEFVSLAGKLDPEPSDAEDQDLESEDQDTEFDEQALESDEQALESDEQDAESEDQVLEPNPSLPEYQPGVLYFDKNNNPIELPRREIDLSTCLSVRELAPILDVPEDSVNFVLGLLRLQEEVNGAYQLTSNGRKHGGVRDCELVFEKDLVMRGAKRYL